MTSFLLVLFLSGSYTATPEEFLDGLCEQIQGLEGARFWHESAWEDIEGSLSDPDSMRVFLEGRVNLSVDPGHRILSEIDEETGRYRVEYPASIWTWSGEDGRMCRTAGPSVIIWSDGHFYWQTLPVIGGRPAEIGMTERFLTGIFFTVIVLLFGMLLIIWAKRKFAA